MSERLAAGRRRVLLGALAAPFAPALARGSSRATALETVLAATRAPGAVVGIAQPRAPDELLALGHADLERSRAISADMHFRIGSVAKLFAGTAVLRLAEAGRIDLDAPIARYVPGIPEGERITLDMLGRHTSGLFNPIESRELQAAIVAAPERQWTDAEILDHVVAKPLAFPPGTGWKYSNANTLLLAMAAEHAAGTPWPDLLRRLVLDPLGLRATGVTPGAGLPPPSPRGYRYGRPGWPIGYGTVLVDTTAFSASWTGAAGNMHATAGELLRAAAPLAGGALLGPEALARLHGWRDTDQPGVRHGFHVFEHDGRIGHPGDVPGFSAHLAWQPATGAAVIAVANLSNTPRAMSPAMALVAGAFAAITPGRT